jgi:predicted O-linked N-acetylglucosamine transferase (SPINDLY family)
MNNDFILENLDAIHQRARQFFLQEDYSQAAYLYEQLIQLKPDEKSYYWHLGLIFLLQGQELEAQATWFIGLSEGDLEQADCWTTNLLDILNLEAEKREKSSENQTAWLIRQHIHEITPDNLNNILQIIRLSISLDKLPEEEIFIHQATNIIKSGNFTEAQVDFVAVSQTIQQLLQSYSVYEFTVNFIEESIHAFPSLTNVSRFLFQEINQIQSNEFISEELVIRLVKLCLHFSPDNLSVLKSLIALQQDSCKYSESIETAEQLLGFSETLIDKIVANYLILRGLMLSGGEWEKSQDIYASIQGFIQSLITNQKELSRDETAYLITMVGVSPYFKDSPKQCHQLRNHISRLYQIDSNLLFPKSNSSKEVCPLKIGYISSCFRRHSVSWLSRWLLKYHNSKEFQVYAYSLRQSNDDLQQFISNQVSKFSDLSSLDTPDEIAGQIHQDKIDILIDLDSVTSQKVSNVMLLKPAPVQVTWLGSDASGVSTVDYFIADNYVLPELAQDYYNSKIWRLPHTYIAVDGFEVGVPTLRRDQLGIPSSAVIFLSSQTGYKRHPDTVRLQMHILHEVPGSYFLVRGLAEEHSIKRFFEEMAEEEGVSCDRLRFLPVVTSEEIHRANLAIADVVLDTYPYNGATTTLETLWMGIPLVTRVGEQFAARNSYAFMKNAGITEGIAWTDKEYVEWGIRLGQDEALRQQVTWKLQQSRKTSPLWNAKQFTREMEDAYRSMWALHLEQQ